MVGKIVAAQRVEIDRNGKVYSDIDTPAHHRGRRVFQGNCVMGEREKKGGSVANLVAEA